ncbi:sulfite exporter TauE/SafE family protein [Halorubraceae archaeon YAN]|nr:sulfite exporter TauE/SafE family protein [Halorubraceae archaeon YAN]
MELFGLSIAILALFIGFGFVVGLLYGFFGMGGSFLVTPALLVLGYPARVAIGSGMAFVFGTAIIAVIKHHGIGQVDYKLGALMFVGLTAGIEGGRIIVFYLEELGTAELIVGITYVVLLAAIGILFTKNALEDDNEETEADEELSHADVDPNDIPDIAKKIQRYNIPPMVTLTGGIRVSLWVITAVSLVVGIVSGFLGIGGGFIRLPAIYYLIGVPLPVAVGTNLFGGFISGGVGAFTYGQAGAVDLTIVLPLLFGSALGAQIGSASTVVVDEDKTRIYFGLMLLIASVAVGIGEAGSILEIPLLDTTSAVLIIGSAVVVALIVIGSGVRAVKQQGRESPILDK